MVGPRHGILLGVQVSLSLTALVTLSLTAAAATTPPPSNALLSLGKDTYTQECAACHGADGRGKGKAADLLDIKPRDFVAAKYRLVSTWERLPTDEDLFNAITRGIPGTAMPSWEHLSEQQRWALAHYVKSFAQTPIAVKPQKAPAPDASDGEGIIAVPPEPSYDPIVAKRAKELYADGCASCHGPTGKGDGVQEQLDEEGLPTHPRDLTEGVFKGNPDPETLYRRIIAGMPGTPMPMSDWAQGKDAWDMVHYVLSLSTEAQRERANRWTPPAMTGLMRGDPDKGKSLFTGAERLGGGGASCRACHSVSGIGALGGGVLGPDLSGAYHKFGDAMIKWTEHVAPMKPIYTKKTLTDEEKSHLLAFFTTGIGRATDQVYQLASIGTVGAIMLLLTIHWIWRSRGREVRRTMYEQSYEDRGGLS